MRVLGSLLLVMLVFSGAALGLQVPEETVVKAPPSDDKPVAGTNEEPIDATLEMIGELEMRFGVVEFSAAGDRGQPFAEAVNPFKARKRGGFYGSIYEYHRNDNLDARNFFDPVDEALPEFKRNQFGFSLGALFSDRLSVFGTYDGLRIVRGSTLVSLIPNVDMKQGNFLSIGTPLRNPFTGQLFEGNQIPDSMIHPVARRMLQTIPDPNRDDPDRNFVNNLPVVENRDNYTGRVDYEFAQGMKIFGQYTLEDGSGANVADLPEFGTNEQNRRQNLSINATRSFGASLVSSLRLNLRRNTFSQLTQNVDQQGLLDSLGINGVGKLDELDEGYPEFDLSGYASLGTNRRRQSPRTNTDNTFSLEGSVTYSPNSHRLSFGAELELNQYNNNRSGGLRRGRFEFSGVYTGDSFADFLLGIPDAASRGVGSDRADLRRTRWKFFFRDEWRVNSKFNLSFSMAYNYFAPFQSVHDNVSIFSPLLFEPPIDGQLVVVGTDEANRVGLEGLEPGVGVYPDRNDWEPRVGVAFSPLGNNRLVIRSSYQISYSPINSRNALEFLGRNSPFYFVEEANAPIDSPDIDLTNPFEAAAAAETTIRGFDPHTRNSYVQEWRLSIQNQIRRNWTIEATYQGRKATRVATDFPANVPLPGPGSIQERRPNPAYGQFEILSSRGSSIGHQLQLQLEKRFSGGFSAQSGFTWDRTFSDQFFFAPADPRNLRLERAISGFSSPLRFNLNYIYDLPLGSDRKFSTAWAGKLRGLLNGWRLSGTTNFTSGRPFSVRLSGDTNNDGVSGDRPDRISSGRLSGSEQSIDRWFDTAAFAEPAEFAIGNAARDILLGPPRQTWDISLIKQTTLTKSGSALEFRIQFFNALNRANFSNPSTTFGTSTFGQISRAEESREIEIALKYSF